MSRTTVRWQYCCKHRLAATMARMVQTSKPTISRAFIGWTVFLSTVKINHCQGFYQANLSKEFHDAGYGDTEALGDAIET